LFTANIIAQNMFPLPSSQVNNEEQAGKRIGSRVAKVKTGQG